jgi:hypothetical protein
MAAGDFLLCQKTKRSIAFVCRYWRDLTTDFLLEDVILHSYRDILCFVALLGSPFGLTTRFHPDHVKRALILPPRHSSPITDRLDEEILLKIFLDRCTNLKVLSIPHLHSGVWPGCPIHPEITTSILARSHSLQDLGLGDWIANPTLFQDPQSFMFLETLSLSFRYWGGDDSNFMIRNFPPASLPRLHTLKLGSVLEEVAEYISEWISGWVLPSLVSVFAGPSIRRHLVESNFLRNHGPKIISLVMGKRPIDHSEGIALPILEQCTSLRNLLFSVTLQSLPTPFTPAHTANVEINFLLYPGRESPAERPTVYSNANISGVFAGESILFSQLGYPQITSVRLTGFQNYSFNSFKWKDRSITDRMERWIKEWRTENVRLEDLTGELLRIPQKLMDSL